jgi:DtxR family transcriptional regulator, Mn-dependent transcriptional regulator
VETTESVQDYLKTIYSLAETEPEVPTSAIAGRLHVSPASVTGMVKRLSKRGYLTYHRYRGVELTPKGEMLALEVIRHHRLLEAYLHTSLGMPWDKVHDEAEVLEHAISEELEDRIALSLGNPTHDPHGDPIPPKDGQHTEMAYVTLDRQPPGRATVKRVSDRDPEALRYLASIGLRPGSAIRIEKHEPFGGPVWIKVGQHRYAIGLGLAAAIQVSGDPV